MDSSWLAQTAAAPDYVQALLLLVFGVMVAAFALVALSRYLHYRETLKLIETGGDVQTVLRLRERWRTRTGLLYGVTLLVGGGMLLLLTAVGPWLRLWPGDFGGPAVLRIIGVFLLTLGAVYLAAYGVWAREQDAFSGTTGETYRPHEFNRLDRRRGLIRGITLMLVGGAVLALAPAFSFLSRQVRGQVFEVEYIIGVIGVLLIALGLTVVVVYWAMHRTPAPPDSHATANTGEVNPESNKR